MLDYVGSQTLAEVKDAGAVSQALLRAYTSLLPSNPRPELQRQPGEPFAATRVVEAVAGMHLAAGDLRQSPWFAEAWTAAQNLAGTYPTIAAPLVHAFEEVGRGATRNPVGAVREGLRQATNRAYKIANQMEMGAHHNPVPRHHLPAVVQRAICLAAGHDADKAHPTVPPRSVTGTPGDLRARAGSTGPARR